MQELNAAGRGTWRIDVALAVLVAAILSASWALNDWARLSHMLLPDPDDMMRLAQVRDWLNGQGINDWTQYRMAPPEGSPMHWSRINDFGIAGLILAATPFAGRADAELFAVLAYPAILFAIALFLSARIGRALWGPGGGIVALVLAAVAFPGTTVFIPGRIDHHALQVILIQLLALALMRASSLKAGALAGLVTGISLVVGLETAPQLVVLVGVLAWFWLVRGEPERMRMAGFAGALALTTIFFLIFLRPTLWTPIYCDAFTPASSTVTLAIAGAFGVLAYASPRLARWSVRLAAGIMVGGGAVLLALAAYPSCINGPYGSVDPFLLREFFPHIDEANSLFLQPRIARIVSLGGLVAAGCVFGAWVMVRERKRWALLLPVVAVVIASALIMIAQIRGAYIGAPLAAPLMAGLVVAARERVRWRIVAVVLAWLAGAGMAYTAIAERIEIALSPAPSKIDPPRLHVLCSEGDAWGQVDRFPPGTVMAGTSVAAYLIGVTHHRTVGAGYHRNNRGNMAMYRFFLSRPDRARAIAAEWNTDYVAFCPGDFGEVDVTRRFPGSVAAELEAGRAPDWLEPLPLTGTPLKFYRVAR